MGLVGAVFGGGGGEDGVDNGVVAFLPRLLYSVVFISPFTPPNTSQAAVVMIKVFPCGFVSRLKNNAESLQSAN